MGGKSSSQTIGYRYFASVMTHLGSRIEKVLGVNFDKRYWFMNENNEPSMHVDNICLYGETEGGVHGMIDIHVGTPDQLPSSHYLEYDPLASGYPYDSYLILRGDDGDSLSFYHGNTNTMREMLVWPKRTRVQNDGSQQWYQERDDGAIVCEIGARDEEEFEIKPISSISIGATFNYDTLGGQDGGVVNVNRIALVNDRWVTYPLRQQSISWQLLTTNVPFRYDISVTLPNADCGYVLVFEMGMRSLGVRPFKPSLFMFSFSEDAITTSEIVGTAVRWTVRLQKKIEGSLTVEGKMTGNLYPQVNQPTPQSNYFFSHYAQFVGVYQEPLNIDGTTGLDINPVHKIREILTNPSPWGMNKPEIDINDENFKKAADRIYDEGLGISWAVNNKNCVDAINELCYHIEGGARINRQTGQYEIVLFRNDWFSSEEIHTLPESKIKSIKPESKSIEDIYNQVNVSFYNREEIKNGAFSIADVGLIKTVGNVITSDVKFPYFQNFKNAEKVAQWKLKQLSTGTWSGSFTTGYKEARKWNRYDLLWLEWSRKWSSPILVRIMSIGLGTATSSTVTIEFEEVVQHSNMGGFITFDPSENAGVQPPQPNNNAVFEVPYYLLATAMGQRVVEEELAYNSDYGIVGAIAEKPQNNSLYAVLQTNDGTGWNERASTVDYVERAELASAVGILDDVFYVSKLPSAVGELALIGNEFVVVESIDPLNSSITVKRGALDTIPVTHDATTEIFYSGTYFAFDAKEYQDGDTVEAYVLTTTPSGIQQPAGAAKVVEMDSRAIRPYPPANVKFDDVHWKQEFTGDLTITWSHRNRAQQTSSEPLGWYEPSVTLEDGVEYVVEYDELSGSDVILNTVVENVGAVDTHTILAADLDDDTVKLAIRLYTVRDGYESMQKVKHTIELSDAFNAPYNLVGTYENDEVTLTWDFDE